MFQKSCFRLRVDGLRGKQKNFLKDIQMSFLTQWSFVLLNYFITFIQSYNLQMSITNKWQEEQYIGKGGYSEVYKVKLHGKYYALKKVFSHIVKDAIRREDIEREILIMESIDHPKIIKLYRSFIEEDDISMLLEYAAGGSLFDTLKNYGKVPERQVKKYVKDIVQALEYLHTREIPILHRDIKPQNLLIDEEGNCKLADFGSANILDGQRLSYVGTLGYIPPQVTQCQPHGIAFDDYSLGVLIYELLTGNIPNEQGEVFYPPFLSRSVEDVIKKLLIKDPSKRMTLSELKQHVWFCEEDYHLEKKQSKEIVNKVEQMKKRLMAKMKDEPSKLVSQLKISKKQKSTVEENQEVNRQSAQYINLVKEKEKLKEILLKNQKKIDQEQSRRRLERPYLLQEIDRVKNAIKEYENDIAILKARPLKKQSQCKHNIESLGRKIEELTQYVKNLPLRVTAELFYVSNFEPGIEAVPVSEYIYKLRNQMMTFYRDSLIEHIATTKTHKQITEMMEIQNEFHMNSVKEEKLSIDTSHETTCVPLKKEKQL